MFGALHYFSGYFPALEEICYPADLFLPIDFKPPRFQLFPILSLLNLNAFINLQHVLASRQ
jgi:hypothetical protein